MDLAIDSTPFLTIEGQSISVGQAFHCLQLFGRLQPFVQEFLRYYTIFQAIQSRSDLPVTASALEQMITHFRGQEHLTDSQAFERWLLAQGIDYPTFKTQIVVGLKLAKLKAKIVEVNAQSYLNAHPHEFDQIEIHQIFVTEESLAHQIKQQLLAGQPFAQIAQTYSTNVEAMVLIKRDVLRRQKLQEDIKRLLPTIKIGEPGGPVFMGSQWCLFQVEGIVPAVLDLQLKQELQEILFEEWLSQRLQRLTVDVPWA